MTVRPPVVDLGRPARSSDGRAGPGRGRALVLVGAGYLVVAVVLWWGVWSTHPSSVTTCGCGDAARFLWYVRWPAYALANGHDLLFSTWLFHPTGINLLDDTSVVALGVALAPVTWAVGPVAAMNVALTLAPALSAWTGFALVRRWVAWTPAAVVAGLVYGFSPFMVTELALNQLNIAFLAVPPLIVLVLADLVGEGRRRAWVDGLFLAGLATVQFFVSTEVLLITALAVAVGLVAVAVRAAWHRPAELRERARRVGVGLATALGAGTVLLAYPVWFLLDGPAHVVGPIWSGGETARYGTTLVSLVSTGGLGGLRPSMLAFGGYQGPALVGLGYLGLGVLAVAVVGAVVWRTDRVLLLFAGVGVSAFVLSLAPGHGIPVPWDALGHLPWVGDIVEGRFTLVVAGCAAVVVGLTLDHVHRALSPPGPTETRRAAPRWGRAGPWAMVAVVVVPTVVVLWPNVPLTVETVVVPIWYRTEGAAVPPGTVVLAYPVPSSGLQSSQAWQAENAMAWQQASGGGPQGQPSRAGQARAGTAVLSAASLPLGPAPQPTAATLAAVRSALRMWGVTTVVVPDQPGLPSYVQGRGGSYAVGFLTAVLGTLPAHVDRAWTWSRVGSAPPPVSLSSAAFTRCTGTAASGPDPLAVPRCVLAAGAAT